MIMYKGFKVIEPTENVVGKVVRKLEEGFEIEEIYINEYNERRIRKLENFDIQPKEDSEQYWKEFSKVLGQYVRINSVHIETNIMEFLNRL